MGSSAKTAAGPATGRKKISGAAKGYLILFLLVFAAWAVFKIITPHNFGSPANLLSYFQSGLLAATGAIGFYFVMVMGMFDFSIGANIVLSAIVGCVLANRFGMGYAGLIIGGGIGNLIDRIFYGYVIDYISLSFFPPVCNFADYAITIGTILLIIYVLFFSNTFDNSEKVAKK